MTQQIVVESAPTSRPAAVYRLFAADGTLLYIGSAYDPERRCESHRKQPWWPEVARRTEEWFEHRGAAYRAESKAIRAEKSMHNQMGTPTYRTPDTEAVRRRKELGPLRQRLLEESRNVECAAMETARADGAPPAEAEYAGELAGIEFLQDTGLFAGAVKERWRRLGLHFSTVQDIVKGYSGSGRNRPKAPPAAEG